MTKIVRLKQKTGNFIPYDTLEEAQNAFENILEK
jgi:hypothetical protein